MPNCLLPTVLRAATGLLDRLIVLLAVLFNRELPEAFTRAPSLERKDALQEIAMLAIVSVLRFTGLVLIEKC
jgi:hypothetical protein